MGTAEGTTGSDGRLVIGDLDALRTIADPLRHQLVALLHRPRTVKELAHELDRPPDRLYYHLRLLERHGFIRTAEGAGARRVYEAAATSVEIDPELALPAASVTSLVNGLLDRVREEFDASQRRSRSNDGVKRTLLSLRHLWLDEDDRAALTTLLEELEGRIHERTESGGGRRPYGIVTGIWPADDEDDAG
jgi:predicted transcriptional regulator